MTSTIAAQIPQAGSWGSTIAMAAMTAVALGLMGWSLFRLFTDPGRQATSDDAVGGARAAMDLKRSKVRCRDGAGPSKGSKPLERSLAAHDGFASRSRRVRAMVHATPDGVGTSVTAIGGRT